MTYHKFTTLYPKASTTIEFFGIIGTMLAILKAFTLLI